MCKLLFLLILSFLFLRADSFTPKGRIAHSSVLYKDMIYMFGGHDGNYCTNEVFHLDITHQFNAELPLWTENTGIGFESCWATTVLTTHHDKPNVYLIGGLMQNKNHEDSFTSMIYTYDPIMGQWNIPVTSGKEPERRRDIQAVADNSGNIYIFGGKADEIVGSNETKYFNDMVIFNAHHLTWSYGPIVNAPLKRAIYTATILSNGMIVYIGSREQIGDNNLREVDINQINVYDTKLASWSVVQAKSKTKIDPRILHTAVLAPDEQIIIYGGATDLDYMKVTPDLIVLNTQTTPFEWKTPPVTSNIGEVPSLAAHTANLYENYMFVAFGNITQLNAPPLNNKNSRIYMFDVRNFTWVNHFEHTQTSESPPNPTVSPTINTSEDHSNHLMQISTMKIIIASISGVFGIAIFLVIGIFSYKFYHKRKQRDVVRITGTNVVF